MFISYKSFEIRDFKEMVNDLKLEDHLAFDLNQISGEERFKTWC